MPVLGMIFLRHAAKRFEDLVRLANSLAPEHVGQRKRG